MSQYTDVTCDFAFFKKLGFTPFKWDENTFLVPVIDAKEFVKKAIDHGYFVWDFETYSVDAEGRKNVEPGFYRSSPSKGVSLKQWEEIIDREFGEIIGNDFSDGIDYFYDFAISERA